MSLQVMGRYLTTCRRRWHLQQYSTRVWARRSKIRRRAARAVIEKVLLSVIITAPKVTIQLGVVTSLIIQEAAPRRVFAARQVVVLASLVRA